MAASAPGGEPLAVYFAGHDDGAARYVAIAGDELVLFDARSGARLVGLAPLPAGRPQLVVSEDATRLALRTSSAPLFWNATTGAAAGRIVAALGAGEVVFDATMRQALHRTGSEVQVWSASPDGAWRARPIECTRCQAAVLDPSGERAVLFHADLTGTLWAWRQLPPPFQQRLPAVPASASGRCSAVARELSDEESMILAVVRCAGSAWPVEVPYYGLTSFTPPVVSADGQLLATPHGDQERGAYNVPHVWSMAAGKPFLAARIVGHTQRVTAMTFDAPGQRLLTADEGGSMYVWDGRTGSQLAALTGHQGAITGVAFHPAGELIASVGTDRHLRLWSARSGRQILDLVMKTALTGVTFEGDGPGRLLGWAAAGFQNEAFRIDLPVDGRRAEQVKLWANEVSDYRIVEGAAVRR